MRHYQSPPPRGKLTHKNMEKNNTSTYITIAIIIVLIIGALFYFKGGKEEAFQNEQNGQAVAGALRVTEVKTRLLDSFPLQVEVAARGELPDTCTTVGNVVKTQKGNTFFITITASREAGKVCAQVVTPFEKKILLDAAGLAAGAYIVNVNGVTATFTLTASDVFQGGKM